MNTTFGTIKLAQPEWTQRVFGRFSRYRRGLRERRLRTRLQSVLSGLSDRELQDIGIARGEIGYVASNRSVDPRHIPVGSA